MVEFHQILRLFNTVPKRPRASPAIFKHVGQVPYSTGFKFGENGPIKILVHFGRQVRYGRISSNFTSFQHSLIGLGPRLQFFSMQGRSPTQGASNLGKGADQNFGPFWPSGPVFSNFIKFYVFSTQSLIGLGPRLQFLSM